MLKNKKVVLTAILVVILGLGIIAVINSLRDNDTISKKLRNVKDGDYRCEISIKPETNAFEVHYENGKPKEVSLLIHIDGPKKHNEDGTLNESEERDEYEAHVESIYLTYNSFSTLKGFTVKTDEKDSEFDAKISVNYDEAEDESLRGMFAGRDETLQEYINRIEEIGYTCKVKK